MCTPNAATFQTSLSINHPTTKTIPSKIHMPITDAMLEPGPDPKHFPSVR
jgi:hypothetical protein